MNNELTNKNRIWDDLFAVLPAFIFIFSLIAVRSHFSHYPMSQYYWHTATDDTTMEDMFGYWKSIFILCGAALGTVYTLVQVLRKKISLNKEFVYIPILVFIVFDFLSLAFSNHKFIALHGANEHFEGTFVLLAYMLALVYLKLSINNERRVKLVIVFAALMTFIACLVGLTQAAGKDFFQTPLGMKVITPFYTLPEGATTWQVIDAMSEIGINVYNFTFTKGQVYQTTYNINYVPFYSCIILAVITFAFIGCLKSDKRNYGIAAILLVLFGLISYNFFYAQSANGYLALAAMGICALIVFRKHLLKWLMPLGILFVVFAVVMGMTYSIWLPELTHSVDSLSKILPGDYVYADEPKTVKLHFDNPPASQYADIDYIETGDALINFSIGGNVLNIRTDNDSIGIFDSDGNQIPVMMEKDNVGTYDILDERFFEYAVLELSKTEDQSYITIKTSEVTWDFTKVEDKIVYINKYGKYVSLRNVPHSTLIKDYSFGSHRGYIWDTAIPLLKDRIFIGSGADTFVAVFPQDDYAVSYSHRGIGGLNTLTDKAHCFYMQTWINTGLISLLAWISLVGCYLYGAIKYFKNNGVKDIIDYINAGIFTGVCGFLAAAILNDGSVSTMPMFYLMVGVGLAINSRDKWKSVDNVETIPIDNNSQEEIVMPIV